ncbi:lactonase family protein [Priestia megaterium]|uniref:lactonase family protein n=1 Tax=Priestia megaterium TaxID=1404 RepID=UPI00366EBBAE
MKDNIELVIGTYQQVGEEAIQIVSLNTDSLEFYKKAVATGINSPSFVIVHSPYLFAVSEKNNGVVVSFYYDRVNNRLLELSRQSTKGELPCYLLFDKQKKTLYAANYLTGNIAVFPVNKHYQIEECKQVLNHFGNSLNKGRQERAHAHSIETIPFAPDYKVVQDLGSDALHLYFTEGDGKLTYVKKFDVPLEHGPRHVAFSRDLKLIYVLSELSSTVDIFQFNVSTCMLQLIQSISTLPEEYQSNNLAADIHISDCGKFLLASNRGHNSIAIFEILVNGYLRLCEITHIRGETPRNFLVLSDNLVIIAAQDSNNVIIAKLQDDGRLHLFSSEYQIKVPVCVKQVL